MKTIAIIGAGVSGLAAATALQRAKEAGADLEFTLYERSERLGGVMVTEQLDGCLIEAGPDSFLSEKTYGTDFCKLFGLGDQIIGSNDDERITYIVVKNRLIAMPDGLMFMVPTKILPTVTTPLFTWGTKIKMGLEFFSKPPVKNGDETVGDLVRRHYGQEVVERLADPLLSGVYGGDADSLSVQAVLPRFADMESKYGSLSKGMLVARKKMAEMTKKMGPNYRPRPLFSSLHNGMQQLIDAVVKFLPADRIRTGVAVDSLQREGNLWRVAINGERRFFDGVVIATPAHAAGRLLRPLSYALASELESVSYSSSVTVAATYNRSDLAKMPPGFGFLVPKSERRRIRALTFVHNKFPHRAPADRGIVRVFLGGLSDEGVLSLSDDEILGTVRRELREMIKLEAEPRTERVYRWNKSMAQYGPGHLDRVKRIREAVAAAPGLALAGNAYQGIGVPDCIASGLIAANSLLDQFSIPRPELGINLQPVATR
ncbi:MAG TPA: protoporphyrinogen oxidase [Terriglobales bacterium]|nr:protoporphyrinogen oxidase [Terriglobales bacterium]